MPRFLRYSLVGALATALHYAVLALAIELFGWIPWRAAGAGALAGALLAYAGNARFTFHRPVLHGGRLLAFLATAALGAVCSMAVVAATVALGGHYLAGQLIATGLSLLLTYAVNRRWTFAAD